MATLTDPARELYDLTKVLSETSKSRGEAFLSAQFGVEAFSTDFFRIISCILERADRIALMVPALPYDQDALDEMLADLKGIKSAFGAESLSNPWSGTGRPLMLSHGKGLQFITSEVRKSVSYPSLDNDEAEELIGLMVAYREQLDEQLLPPFLRQAVIDGLEKAEFQLRHLRWVGGAALLSVFRELQVAADHVEKYAHGIGNPVFETGIILSGLREIGIRFFSYVSKTKEYSESASWLLLTYNTVAPAAGFPQLPQLPGR